jgi:hypothetical protein
MNSLLAGIEQERAAALTGKPKTIDAALPRDGG